MDSEGCTDRSPTDLRIKIIAWEANIFRAFDDKLNFQDPEKFRIGIIQHSICIEVGK